MSLDKNDVENLVRESILLHQRPISFYRDDLRFAFGFKRMGGEEIALRKLFSSKSEEQLQTLSPMELDSNINEWKKEIFPLLHLYYDYKTDLYIFSSNQLK